MRETSHPRLRAALPLALKVPEITLIFWVLKLLTTGMGEAMSDFMGQQSVPIAGRDRDLRARLRAVAAVPRARSTARPSTGSR